MPDSAVLEPVLSRLAVVRSRIRRLYLLDGLALLVIVACAALATTFVLDYFLDLPRAVRMVFLFGSIAACAWTALRKILAPLAVPISDDDLAVLVERSHPELKDRLISAIQLSRPSDPAHRKFNSPELVEALVRDAADASRPLSFDAFVTHTHIRNRGVFAAGFVVALAALGFFFSDLSTIFLNRFLGGDARWPQQTYLTVEGFDADRRRVVAKGEDFTISVAVKGKVPSTVRVFVEFIQTGEKFRDTLARIGDKFTLTLESLGGPIQFRVKGGDDFTDYYVVDTLNPPTLIEHRLWYDYPNYLGKTDTSDVNPEHGGSTVQVPVGTRVKFEGISGVELSGATVRYKSEKDETECPIERIDAHRFSAWFDVLHPRAKYEVVLHGANGLSSNPLVFDITGLPDLAPEVLVEQPRAKDEYVAPKCVYPIRLTVKDDYGVKAVKMLYRTSLMPPDAWTEVLFGPAEHPNANYPGAKEGDRFVLRSRYSFHIPPLNLNPNDWVSLKFVVEDYKDVGGPNVTTTTECRFTIAPVTQIEYELERLIEEIRKRLEETRRIQRLNRDRSKTLLDKVLELAQLTGDQLMDIEERKRDQTAITRELTHALQSITLVLARGKYNKIFDDRACEKLIGALGCLNQLVGPDEKPAPVSPLAAAKLGDAARAADPKGRETAFEESIGLQDDVVAGIERALGFLGEWTNYQEVVRMTREVRDEAERFLIMLRKLFGGSEPPKEEKNP